MVYTLINKYLTWMKPVYSGKACLPELIFLREKKTQHGFKGYKNRLTLSLGGNAQDDVKTERLQP